MPHTEALEKKWHFSGVASSFPIFEVCTDVFSYKYGQKSLVVQPHTLEGVVTLILVAVATAVVIQPHTLEGVVTPVLSSQYLVVSFSTPPLPVSFVLFASS